MPARLTRQGPAPKIGIVHLGPGAFFRAFNAIYTDDAMAHSGGDWGILGVSLKSAGARDQLAPQGGAYTSVTLSEGRAANRIINSVARILVAPEDPKAVVAAMADPAVKIISLTITEKGYCHAPATGALQMTHPDIQHDLNHLDAPRSAVGFIVAALRRRRDAEAGPVTVLSCDNLPANGALIRSVVLEFAGHIDADLRRWIAGNVTFPATMVDRITPATTPADIERLAAAQEYDDPACVVHEAFRQWVIEDSFASGRPSWDAVGAQLVFSVAAHEEMKLRCLNGTHSTLAYLGYLAGHATIADCMADPVFEGLCDALWRDEITPVLDTPEGEDLPRYCATLKARYRDRAIQHRTWQIAMDGSQKLPQRLLGTIRDNLDRGVIPQGLCLAVAGWMRYVGGVDETGQPIDVRDPMAARLRQISDSAKDPVAALLDVTEVFGPDLPQHAGFCTSVRAAFDQVTRAGARAAVAQYVQS